MRAAEVWYSYGHTDVLRGVSFQVRSGETVALAGPNGSGKTTLLKLLSGSIVPRRGKVYFGDDPVASLPPRRRAQHIAVVSQHVNPSLNFRVDTLVMMGRTPYTGFFGSTALADRRAVTDALLATETNHLSQRRFNQLSGGEQQRVAVAMALAQETDFLLLDEPTVHLDLHHQHELLELLQRLHKVRGLGILAVMHDLNLATLYFDRLAVLHEGRVVADGTSSDVLTTPEVMAAFKAPFTLVRHPQNNVPQVLLKRHE
jgi:iron complex transport system ATP-binding protein